MSRAFSVQTLRVGAAVAAGGAIGAALRVAVVESAEIFGVPGWVGIVLVNLLGGVGIGVAFVHLEARFIRGTRSRLAASPHAAHVTAQGWRLDADQTLDPVDLFRAEARMRIHSGYWVTGFLGGFTTFSSFALVTWQLAAQLPPMAFALVYVVAAVLPIGGTLAGLVLGAFTLPSRPGEVPG